MYLDREIGRKAVGGKEGGSISSVGKDKCEVVDYFCSQEGENKMIKDVYGLGDIIILHGYTYICIPCLGSRLMMIFSFFCL